MAMGSTPILVIVAAALIIAAAQVVQQRGTHSKHPKIPQLTLQVLRNVDSPSQMRQYRIRQLSRWKQ